MLMPSTYPLGPERKYMDGGNETMYDPPLAVTNVKESVGHVASCAAFMGAQNCPARTTLARYDAPTAVRKLASHAAVGRISVVPATSEWRISTEVREREKRIRAPKNGQAHAPLSKTTGTFDPAAVRENDEPARDAVIVTV